MPENCTIPPEGYMRIEQIDLQHNKKTSLFINLFSVELFIVFLVPLFFLTNVPSLLKGMISDVSIESLTATVILCAGIVIYLALHEITHGIFMKIFGKTKVNYGFNGLYAHTGSMAYLNKRSYIITALAPLVIWGIIFTALAVHTYIYNSVYFHVCYVLGVINISGSAGDMYMAVRISRMDRKILIKDSGTNMMIYGTHADNYEM